MDAKAGFFYFRELFGMVTSAITIGTTAPVIVFMYLDNPTILNDLETCKYVTDNDSRHKPESCQNFSLILYNGQWFWKRYEYCNSVLISVTKKKSI